MKVLNIGGANKDIPIPQIFDGWDHILLDISPQGNPDILADARDLFGIDEKFDAIYCSHVLEHFYAYEVSDVLDGFKFVLKPEGFAFIRVPDLAAVLDEMISLKLDLDSTIYLSAAGPITPLDVIYGYQPEIIRSKKDYYAHKLGYSEKTIGKLLREYGFVDIKIMRQLKELQIVAYLQHSVI